jgi:hypothetical protein
MRLVAAQIAGLPVLAGSGLLLRTYERPNAVRPGFDPQHVSTFWVSLPAAGYKRDTDVVAFYSRLVDRVAPLPGVQVVGLTSRLPLESHGLDPNPLYPEDDPSFATRLPPLQLFTAINGDYFRAMGIPILAGRTFARMGAQREGDAIVSRSAAEFFWKDSTGVAALGKRFRPLPTSRWYTVIGVVGDTRDTTLVDASSPAVYMPETLEDGGGFAHRWLLRGGPHHRRAGADRGGRSARGSASIRPAHVRREADDGRRARRPRSSRSSSSSRRRGGGDADPRRGRMRCAGLPSRCAGASWAFARARRLAARARRRWRDMESRHRFRVRAGVDLRRRRAIRARGSSA